MSLVLGQIIHTSFRNVGFKTLASARVPEAVQQAFLQQIAYRYWDAYDPPEAGYQAVYLHQLSREKTLFGWLYSDGPDDWERNHVPCFICYYLAEPLQAAHLEVLIDCLAQGPATIIERYRIPDQLQDVIFSERSPYRPSRPGVKIPPRYRNYSYDLLRQESLINFFLPGEMPVREKPHKGWDKKLKSITTQITATSGPQTWIQTTQVEGISSRAPAPPERPFVGTRVALLAGVSNYGPGLETLAGVSKDLSLFKQVLEDASIGSFTAVDTLLNADPEEMMHSIEHLFINHQDSDLILFYFSGHGVCDQQGRLYLTTGTSRRGSEKQVIPSTIIPLAYLWEVMQNSANPKQQQIVILDCCFSEAVGGTFRQNHPIQLRSLPLQDNCALLLSSSATQHPFAQKGSDHSIYTFYFVEGLATGAADLNQNGEITIQELHNYAKHKVKAISPAIHPCLRGRAASQAVIATISTQSRKWRYRMEVERRASASLSVTDHVLLEALRDRLGLTPAEAVAIDAEVLKPYHDYQIKLKEYTLGLLEAIQEEFPLSPATHQRFQEFQELLGLTHTDTQPIHLQVAQYLSALDIPQPQTSIRPTLGMRARYWQQQTAHLRNLKPAWLWLGFVMASLLLVGLMVHIRRTSDAQRWKPMLNQFNNRVYEQCVATIGNRIQEELERLLAACQAGVNWQTAQVRTLSGHQGTVWAVSLSPDGQLLASGSEDQRVRLWSVRSGQLVNTLVGHRSPVWSVAFSPNGQQLASGGSDREIRLWQLPKGESPYTLRGHQGTVRALRYSPSGKTLISSSDDGTLRLWNLENGQVPQTLTGGIGAIRAIALNSDGTLLASGGENATIQVWDLKTGHLQQQFTGHRGRIISLAISQDNKLLISGSTDRMLKIWDLKRGQLLTTLFQSTDWINAVALSPDQLLLAVGNGSLIQLWNFQTGQLMHTLMGDPQDITALEFRGDGRLLVSASRDETIRLWER